MILAFITAFLITVVLTPFTIRLMKKYKIVDDPNRQNHPGIIHKKPIPRGGGIPLFIGVLIAAGIFLPLNQTTIAIFLAGSIALIVGVLDDKLNAKSKDVSPYVRFLINILCAIIVVGSGITVPFITNPFGGILQLDQMSFDFLNLTIRLSDLIAITWIIWVMNMLNWSKGVDGQMPGVVAISALVIGILSLRFPTAETGVDATLSFIIAGSAIGFLLFNFYPARIFPGYGATAVYLLLAVVSILSSVKLATAVLVMGVPLVDGVFTILRRVASRKSPFTNDNKHLHHLLLRLGFSQRNIALFYWTVSGILGAISLSFQSQSKFFVIIMLGVIVGGGLLFLHLIVSSRNEKNVS